MANVLDFGQLLPRLRTRNVASPSLHPVETSSFMALRMACAVSADPADPADPAELASLMNMETSKPAAAAAMRVTPKRFCVEVFMISLLFLRRRPFRFGRAGCSSRTYFSSF